MARNSKIEWTTDTWNPWIGCSKVSPGCASCYAEREMSRYGRDFDCVKRTSDRTFSAPRRWARSSQGELFGGTTARVFTCSWSDFFHEGADAWRDDAWSVIRDTPGLTYQILTKRPELVRDRLPADWGLGWPHVWLGVSVENQHFETRARILNQIPAVVRFISAEPLLRSLDLSRVLGRFVGGELSPGTYSAPGIDWLIVGGESGGRPGHPVRPLDPEWVRDLRDQAIAAGIPFFFKQWGGKLPGGEALLDGREWREFPE